MAAIQYLTVQDILWINLQVTKKVNHYNFAKLEEATFYQYSYGDSNSLLKQACRFLPGFLKMKPFDAGNFATASVAFLAFLELNHAPIKLADDQLLDWFEKSSTSGKALLEEVPSQIDGTEGHGHEKTVRQAIQAVINRYESTVTTLVQRD